MQQTMIVSSHSDPSVHACDNAVVVATSLDAIVRLEKQQIATVVLVGANATNNELADFIGEFYPSIRIQREVGDVATR
jgi:hypothetical protein